MTEITKIQMDQAIQRGRIERSKAMYAALRMLSKASAAVIAKLTAWTAFDVQSARAAFG